MQQNYFGEDIFHILIAENQGELWRGQTIKCNPTGILCDTL